MFLVSLADLFVVLYYFWFVCLNCENIFLLHFPCVYSFLGGWSGLPFWCGTSYVLPIGEVIEAWGLSGAELPQALCARFFWPTMPWRLAWTRGPQTRVCIRSPEGPAQNHTAGPQHKPQPSDLAGLGWGLNISVSNKFQVMLILLVWVPHCPKYLLVDFTCKGIWWLLTSAIKLSEYKQKSIIDWA